MVSEKCRQPTNSSPPKTVTSSGDCAGDVQTREGEVSDGLFRLCYSDQVRLVLWAPINQ